MQRWATLATAAALAVVSTSATAQDEAGPGRTGFLDLGVYTGGSFASDWFTARDADGGGESWRPGYAPGFGAVAQLWLEPRIGLRLHGAYLPQNLPGGGGLDQGLRVVNSYVYDVGVVVRPLILSTSNTLLQTVYLFAGGGAYTANVGDFMSRGTMDGCIPDAGWVADGVCVSTDPSRGTTGMATAGGGIRLARVTRAVEAFGEVAVHAYDSPAHVREDAGGEDRLTWMPRAVIGLKSSIGRPAARRSRAEPEPAATPTPLPTPRPIPSPPAPAPRRAIEVCGVRGGELARVPAELDPATGDTTVNGVAFRDAFPASETAGEAAWLRGGEPVVIGRQRFVPFGPPRVIDPAQLARVGEFRGIAMFGVPGARLDVVYVPVRQGCEFQPYQVESKVGPIRG
jgi:hypothetical protein